MSRRRDRFDDVPPARQAAQRVGMSGAIERLRALTMDTESVLSTLMSKGPGKVQREIAALIEAEPDGAWSYEELARLIYGQDGRPLLFGSRLRARKVAVGRALSTMQLPGTWVVVQAVFFHDRRFWLYDPCRLESWRKISDSQRWPCDPLHWQPGGVYYGWWLESVRRRDAKEGLVEKEAGLTCLNGKLSGKS